LPNYCHHQPSTSTSSSEKSEDEEYPDQFFFVAGKGLGQQPLLLKETSRRGLGSSDIRCCKLKGKPRPSMVNYYAFNSSINTQTTDTQTSEMDFYRRCS
jgi:hypothetical protein